MDFFNKIGDTIVSAGKEVTEKESRVHYIGLINVCELFMM